MIVFNCFSTMKRYGSMPLTDILIWTTSLIRLKSMQYVTKLYCDKSSHEFLDKWHLRQLYDIIDDEFYEQDKEKIESVDSRYFWSTRKIEAMHHELELGNDSIYSDTDIIMRKPFDLSGDFLCWCPEEGSIENNSIYVPWRNLSKPLGYMMPKWMLETKDAYNGGIWWFKNKDVYEEYRTEYYRFAVNNPCKIKHTNRDDVSDLITNNNVWACNGEQRVLKAVLDHNNQEVKFIMDERKKGWSKDAVHFFHYRIAWRYLHDKVYDPAPDALPMLNLTIKECMLTVKAYNKSLHDFWLQYFSDYEKIDAKNKIWPIQEYI